jgi:hypothetical protein
MPGSTMRMKALHEQPLLTKSEIERKYHVSARTVTRLIESGALTPVRVGKTDRVAEADWLRHLSGQRA